MPIKNCANCESQFSIPAAWERKGGGKYCSVPCKNEGQKNTSIPSLKLVHSYQSGLSCHQIAKKYGLSSMVVHRRLKEAGVEMRSVNDGILLAYKDLKGPNSKNWKGGRQLKRNRSRHKEYWLIYKPNHPRAWKSGYVGEHIYVWEKSNGCSLPKGWHVHHKNGIGTDNRPENLEAMTASRHTKIHNDLRAKELEDAKARIKELEAETKELKDRLSQLLIFNPLN